MSLEEAAAFPLVFETAYRMLATKAGLREGEWVLLWGIGGGLANAANVIARALGARTIVTSSSDDKLERTDADVKVNHASADVAGTARRAAHAVRRPEDVELDDATLVDKVESIVFRKHDVPKGQININAENGVVFLRGQVEDPGLVETLETRVRKVRGVKDVENLLHTSEPPA